MLTMSGQGKRVGYGLSPNEEAALLKEEQDRRRKLRLKQVREQDRLFAKQLLAKARAKKEVEVNALSARLEEEWETVQREKQEVLQEVYDRCLERVGQGHRAAHQQKPMDGERAAAAVRNAKAAQERHLSAVKREVAERDDRWQKENAHIVARKNALDVEKVRASYVAGLPPKRDPLANLDLQKPPIQVARMEGFATTHYHIPAEYVEKAEPHQQEDARQAAREEDERMRAEMEKLEVDLRERKEKASLRHKHAKEKELLKQDYDKLLLELSDLQHADRRRRQAVVADIPRQVFQPPHRRLEDKVERQHQLEEAFEDMYMKHTDYAGDITLALEPRVPDHDAELDLTADTAESKDEVTLERPAGPTASPPTALAQAGPTGAGPKPASARAEMLKRLMGRVRGQQDDWRKQKTKGPTAVATGRASAIQTHTEEDETSSASDPLSAFQPMAAPTSPATTTPPASTPPSLSSPPTELSEHPIGSGGLSLETGSLSEGSSAPGSTLLHPMEHAARIRAKQITDQRRTQIEIKAIGEEQEKRLRDLQQAFYVPWDDIPQSRVSPTGHDQDYAADGVIENEVGYHKETSPSVDISHRSGICEEGTDINQVQRDVQHEELHDHLVEGQADIQPRLDDHQEPISHSRQDGFIDALDSEGIPRQDPDLAAQVDVRNNLPYSSGVLHDLSRQSQVAEESKGDWIQRARAYQQRLLDRQKHSQDSLWQAQLSLQERREKLMRNYPDINLPTYEPYCPPARMAQSSKPSLSSRLGTGMYQLGPNQGVMTAASTERRNLPEAVEEYGADAALEDRTEIVHKSPSTGLHPVGEETRSGGLTHRSGVKSLSPSKRQLQLGDDADEDVNVDEGTFAPMAEELASQNSTSESGSLDLVAHKQGGDSRHVADHSLAQQFEGRRVSTKSLHSQMKYSKEEGTRDTSEEFLEMRHHKLMEEKRVLEEKQKEQQMRLMQKQHELSLQIKRQQERYQERIKASQEGRMSAIVPQARGPPIEHSPSIPPVALQSNVYPESPTMFASGTASFDALHSSGRNHEQVDMKELMQGQVFRPEDLLPHLQGSQDFGSELEDEEGSSFQSSQGLHMGTVQAGNMMMGVLKPRDLLPHLPTTARGADDLGFEGSGPFTLSGSLYGHGQTRGTSESYEQGIHLIDGHSQDISEGTLDMDSTESPDTHHGRFVRNRLQGQVLRSNDLLSQLQQIHKEAGISDNLSDSNELVHSEADNSIPKSDRLGSSGMIHSGLMEQMTGEFSHSEARAFSSEMYDHSSHDTSSMGRNQGPGGVFKDLLQGHVFRPNDLLPHLQGLPQDMAIHGPSLSSTHDHSDPSISSFAYGATRPGLDGGGTEQPFSRLSLTNDEIQASSPNFTQQDTMSFHEPAAPAHSSLAITPQGLPESQVIRSRRPPPANLHQMAILEGERPPHELSTILELETSADERMHVMTTLQAPITDSGLMLPPVDINPQESFLGKRMPTFGGPASAAESVQTNVGIEHEQRGFSMPPFRQQHRESPGEIVRETGPVIQLARPVVTSSFGIDNEGNADAEGSTRLSYGADIREKDTVSTLSDYTLEEEDATNTSSGTLSVLPSHIQAGHVNREVIGSYDSSASARVHQMQREEPAGQSTRWKDLLRTSDTSTSSSDDGLGKAKSSAVGADISQFLPMKETDSTLTATQDSSFYHLLGQSTALETNRETEMDSQTVQAPTKMTQSQTMQMQKHIAAGLYMDSSTSSGSQKNKQPPLGLGNDSSSSPTSSSKQSTVIGAIGRVWYSHTTDDDDDSPLFVPKSLGHQEFPFPQGSHVQQDSMDSRQHMTVDQQSLVASGPKVGEVALEQMTDSSSEAAASGYSQSYLAIPPLMSKQSSHTLSGGKNPDAAGTGSKDDYLRNMLISLQYGKERGMTMPLFSDVSLSGFSVSREGSVTEIMSPVKTTDRTPFQLSQHAIGQREENISHPALGQGHTFPSLSDLQMETGIMEEPDLTFHTTFDTTADSIPPAAGPVQHERQSPAVMSVGSSRSRGLTGIPLDLSQSSETSVDPSLLSFQQHERDLLETSPQLSARHSQSREPPSVEDDGGMVDARQTRSEGHVSHTAIASKGLGAVSLQEAFLQRKQTFVHASQTRQQEVKVRAESRSQEVTAFVKTLQDWKRSKVKSQRKQSNLKKVSTSKSEEAVSATSSRLGSTLVNPTDRTAVEREMRGRNLRLYNQLEEVQRDKAEKQRREAYAANRQKKKDFEQKLQARRAKKKASAEIKTTKSK